MVHGEQLDGVVADLLLKQRTQAKSAVLGGETGSILEREGNGRVVLQVVAEAGHLDIGPEQNRRAVNRSSGNDNTISGDLRAVGEAHADSSVAVEEHPVNTGI